MARDDRVVRVRRGEPGTPDLDVAAEAPAGATGQRGRGPQELTRVLALTPETPPVALKVLATEVVVW